MACSHGPGPIRYMAVWYEIPANILEEVDWAVYRRVENVSTDRGSLHNSNFLSSLQYEIQWERSIENSVKSFFISREYECSEIKRSIDVALAMGDMQTGMAWKAALMDSVHLIGRDERLAIVVSATITSALGRRLLVSFLLGSSLNDGISSS